MGITTLTFSALVTPLQQFADWLAGAALSRSRRQPARGAQSSRTACASVRRGPVHHGALPLRRPLRVVRVVDASHAPATAGRMVISGRMADVCAELERLAAMEPDQALAPSR